MEALTNKVQIYVNKCLRRVMKIWWPRSIANDELLEKCYQLPIVNAIRRRKWSWFGHTQRKPFSESCRQALEWNSQGSRQGGRPKMSWKRSFDIQIKSCRLTWKKLKVHKSCEDPMFH